jgi:hypothetical protein
LEKIVVETTWTEVEEMEKFQKIKASQKRTQK